MATLRAATLRSRFGWRAFWVTLIILVSGTVATGWFWRGQVINATRDALEAHISTVQTALQIDIASGFDPFADGRVFLLVTPEIGLQILSGNGDLLAVSADLTRMPLIPLDEVSDSEGIERRQPVAGYGDSLVRAVRVDEGEISYYIEVVTTLDELDRASTVTYVFGPIVSLGVAALMGISVSFTVGAALSPVQRLSERAAVVADGGQPEALNVAANTAELEGLSRDLDHLLERIRQSFDREQQFLDDASHELRTPIAIALTELDLARREASEENTRLALESALEELRRLDRMASDLLVLARERAAGTEGFVPVDLGAVGRAAAEAVRRDPRQRAVRIEVSGTASIVGDCDSLERALVNLIANAARYCDQSVRVTISQSDHAATVVVADDGPGIPDHLIDDMFDRFVRGRSRGARSTGLGTAIASEVIRHHGGVISAANRPEGGAVVTMRFPPSPSPPGPEF
jgi:signal transduction histidine kinase